MNKYKKEYAWIKKKLKKGQSQSELLNCVGSFSNKSKIRVMNEKNITKDEYEKRYKFLENVYYLLSSKKFNK